MQLSKMIEHLTRSGDLLVASFEGVSDEMARFRPERGRWSMKEVLGHLADEEQLDFAARMRLTVEQPSSDWPAIPAEGPEEKRQQDEPLAILLASFMQSRAESLSWLRTLSPDCLEKVHTHARLGSMSAGDLLAAWCAHDLRHLDQIVRTRLAFVKREAEPYSTAYSG